MNAWQHGQKMALTPDALLAEMANAWRESIDGYSADARFNGRRWFHALAGIAIERQLDTLVERAKAAAEAEVAHKRYQQGLAIQKGRRE